MYKTDNGLAARIAKSEASLPYKREYKLKGNLITQKYYCECLLPYYIEARLDQACDWVLQEDNDLSHGTRNYSLANGRVYRISLSKEFAIVYINRWNTLRPSYRINGTRSRSQKFVQGYVICLEDAGYWLKRVASQSRQHYGNNGCKQHKIL